MHKFAKIRQIIREVYADSGITQRERDGFWKLDVPSMNPSIPGRWGYTTNHYHVAAEELRRHRRELIRKRIEEEVKEPYTQHTFTPDNGTASSGFYDGGVTFQFRDDNHDVLIRIPRQWVNIIKGLGAMLESAEGGYNPPFDPAPSGFRWAGEFRRARKAEWYWDGRQPQQSDGLTAWGHILVKTEQANPV